MECASHAHVTHDRKASAQGTPPNFEIGFPQNRRVRIGEEVLDERLRCIANARFLPDWAIYPLERNAAAFEQAGGRARGEVVSVAVEVRLAQPEAGALAGAARKRQARAATKEDVEMVVVNLRVVAHRRRAKERAGFGAGLRANPGFGRVIQRRKDYALLMQGYNSRRSVELPAVWPNAGFVGKGLRDRRRTLASRQAPPFRLEAEVCLGESSGSRPGLRDAGPSRVAPLKFGEYRLDPGGAPG